ncbi:MAG: hypothetical protein Q8M73_06530 [Actinomycetota bacterium]|nr:hypothetical protein [Actinomycetota bacterium]
MTAPGSVPARIAAAMIGLVCVFQLAIVLGAPWGEFTQGGANEGSLPAAGRAIAGVSLVLLAAMSLVLLARVGAGPLRSAAPRLLAVLGWVTVVYFGLGIVLNLATPSTGERMVWAPLTAVIFILALIAMIRSRRPAQAQQ